MNLVRPAVDHRVTSPRYLRSSAAGTSRYVWQKIDASFHFAVVLSTRGRDDPPPLLIEKGTNLKQLLIALFTLCALARAQESNTQAATQPTLTIYNQNFFVARETVPLDLKPGINRIDYIGASAHIEPDSVILRDPSGRALQILEQNYRNDPVSQELLLSYYEGKTIDFLANLGQGPVTVKGKIIRSGYVPAYRYSGKLPAPDLQRSPSSKSMAYSVSAFLASRCFPLSAKTPLSSPS